MLLGFLWSSVLSPLLRFVLLYPYALLKGRRSRAARVEAICYSYCGRRTMTHTWTTTADQADSVLGTVALALEDGKIAAPVGAVYLVPGWNRELPERFEAESVPQERGRTLLRAAAAALSLRRFRRRAPATVRGCPEAAEAGSARARRSSVPPTRRCGRRTCAASASSPPGRSSPSSPS